MVEFNKLVRDHIPEIIQLQGESAHIQVLSDDRFIFELDRKLCEEVQEYQQSKDIEELADILEVIEAICQARGCSLNDLHKLKEEKCKSRGAFSKRYYLVSKE